MPDWSAAHLRLKWSREQAFDTAKEAAEALKLPEQTYYHHERGTRGWSRSGQRYATFFKVDYMWLMTGKGTPDGGDLGRLIRRYLPADKAQTVLDLIEFQRNRKP